MTPEKELSTGDVYSNLVFLDLDMLVAISTCVILLFFRPKKSTKESAISRFVIFTSSTRI